MNVAVIGNGGREHALVWKLSQSRNIGKLYALPGNPGTMNLAENVEINPLDFKKILRFCESKSIGLVVIGPEDPLAAGLVDALTDAGIRAFGPTKEAAQLESDKWFAKELMKSQAVPTGEARLFTTLRNALAHIETREPPFVIKAAGLAKGKGVTIAYSMEDAITALTSVMQEKIFGDAGTRVVIEEYLTGIEASVIALVSGNQLYMLEPCQDYKSLNDGNTGPMTGGMGAISPTPNISRELLATLEREVFIPVLDGLKRDGITYKGVLYAGIMLTESGPRVLEFNCRFGDPETQVLMMRLQNDLLEVMNAVVDGKLDSIELKWDKRPSICVVATDKGYPGKTTSGLEITGVKDVDDQDD
ncbi:MAG TPA: phosphoribosylamine--glycine ligase, partial [Tepidisphaeraceae bacterium]|nr:phosphoribosylamine--glycine ligase [Tepidisphaeraceae bacterium]